MWIASASLLSCDVIVFKTNLTFLIISIHFSTRPKSQEKKLNILRTKIIFKVKEKAFFIFFKGFSVAKNCLRPESTSLRDTFTAVEKLMKRKINVCLTSESKIDESIPNQQFKVNGYKTIQRDKDRFGGGLNEQIPSKVPTLESIQKDIQLTLLYFTVNVLDYKNHHFKMRNIFLIICRVS